MQATLYEGERTRYHRRIVGIRAFDATAVEATSWSAAMTLSPEASTVLQNRSINAFEHRPTRKRLAEAYRSRAAPALKAMALLSNNMRVLAIYLTCLAGRPEAVLVAGANCDVRNRRRRDLAASQD